MCAQHVPHNPRKRKRKQNGLRKRHWCFTSFLDSLPTTFNEDIVRYVIYQREVCPESEDHKKHFQGYIEFFDNVRIGQVKKVLGECHLEPRRGSRTEARNYCRKEESAIPDTQFSWGVWRDDLARKRSLHDMLMDKITIDELIEIRPVDYIRYYRGLERLQAKRQRLLAKEFRFLNVEVYIGKTGCGKSRRAIEENPDHYKLPTSSGTTWCDGYNGEKCLIIDDFYGGIKYSLLLNILDGYELQMQIKGGYVWAGWTKVVITSNHEPDTWYSMGLTPALRRRITTIIHM